MDAEGARIDGGSDVHGAAIEADAEFRPPHVVLDPAQSGITRSSGIGYGDSYVMDPHGEILVQSRRHQEDFITAEIDPNHQQDTAWGLSKSAWSFREFAPFVAEAMKKHGG